MAWETRNGTGHYYTRSFRVNGRMVREYVGAGPAGELAALEDQREREKRRLEREAHREERQRQQAITQVLDALAALSTVSLKKALGSAGYHCHRGQWRKQRIREVNVMNEVQPPPEPPPDRQAVHEIMQAVHQRRPGSLQALERLTTQSPQAVIAYGDTGRLAEESLLQLTAGDDAINREARQSWLEDTRRRLAEAGDGELERQVDPPVLSQLVGRERC